MTQPISFVAFYISLSADTMQQVHQRTPSITVSEPYRFIELMFASARLFHPDCHQLILTDQNTPFPPEWDFEIVRLDLDGRQPMLARSSAWLQYIQRTKSHLVFLDSDILVNANLNHIFETSFDVALTYRAHQEWPINAGINFVHAHHLDGAYAFHHRWFTHFQKAYAHQAVWGGDQDVLGDLIQGADFSRADSYLHQQDSFRIFLLPCEIYNFSSVDEYGMTGYYPEKAVLHFKGRRKSAMLLYWDHYLQEK